MSESSIITTQRAAEMFHQFIEWKRMIFYIQLERLVDKGDSNWKN